MSPPQAKVYLIGAGPGDPGLLTLRGRDCLARADLVLYDYLVDERILRFAKPGAELECLGRHGHERIVTQDEVHARMIAAARDGQTVARLKGGDPVIFGRLAEEAAALEAAGVAYEVVPGVTSASAASAFTGIPLTHRGAASCVAFITGQECEDKDADPLDLAALARFPGTLVFYMGVTSAPKWAAVLLANGKRADTPVAIVRRASWPQQAMMLTTLGDLPALVASTKLRPPAIIIVGEAVAERSHVDWFAQRPLFGQTIVVTRPPGQTDLLVDRLAELGARVLLQPAITIAPPQSWEAVDLAIRRLDEFDWVVFSSANGVEHFLGRLAALGKDARALGRVRIAAIGPATAEALAAHHLRADAQPEEYRAEALAELLAGQAKGRRFLLVRASRGREVLAETLRAAGAIVGQAIAYESRDVAEPTPEVGALLESGGVDWITVTSSAIARSLVAMFGKRLQQTKLVAISPLTAGVLADAGYPPAATAAVYTVDGVVAAIRAAISHAD